jgi:lipoprotein-releasing system permease protein
MLFNQFALRYIFGKKNTKAINIISWISMVAIAIGTAALIIVLSVFNGFGQFIQSLYNNFYTDLKISPISGKHFLANPEVLLQLTNQAGVKGVAQIYEDNILLKSDVTQSIVTLRGVDENYAKLTGFNSSIQYGDSQLFTLPESCIIGMGVANTLQVSDKSIEPMQAFAFVNNGSLSNAPENAFTQTALRPIGIFSVQDEFDNKYILSSLAQAQTMLQMEGKLTSYAVQLNNSKDADKIKEKLLKQLAPFGLQVETRFEQNKTLNYVLKSEKLMVYGVMTFMLLIAAFNILASLSMLVMEKQKDINIMRALGANNDFIKNIFLRTGLLIGGIGALSGLIIGVIFCLAQQQFGWIKMSGEGLLLEAYPVHLKLLDIVLVVCTVFIITTIAAYLPSKRASKSDMWFSVR